MKVLVKKESNEVIAITEKAEVLENGVDTGTTIYSPSDILNVFDVADVPNDFVPTKYLYIEGTGFIKNPNYKEFKTTDQQIEDLKAQLISTQDAINSILGI